MDERVRQLLDETEAARGEVLELVTGLTEEQFALPTTNEGWSVRDTLAHLSSIEARARLTTQRALAGETWTAARTDLDEYNARCVEERRAWTTDAVVAELRATGEETAEQLAQVTSEQFNREWVHPLFGRMTIGKWLGVPAQHLRSHAKELRAALQT